MSDDPTDPVVSDVDGVAMSDDHVLAELRAGLDATDPPPPRLATVAKAALTWRTIDAELAALTFDSARDLAGVRDQTLQRQVTFEAADLEIEVMLADAESRRLVGQLVPALEATVVLVAGDDDLRLTTTSDALGRFDFDDVPDVAIGFVVLDAAGRPLVRTEPIDL